jgi:hypothetical protein
MTRRIEVSVEVGPIDPATVDALKAAGYAVFRGPSSWRVDAIEPVISPTAIRAQAHVLMRRIVDDYGLETLSEPPAFALRDPDDLDTPGTELMLDDVRRAYQPDPLPRPRRRWYQRMMELGLGERKGD